MTHPVNKLLGAAAPVVGTLLGGPIGGVAGTAIGRLLGATQKGSAATAEPVVMPSPNDEAARAARRRAQMQLSTRSGRQSTVLSTSDTLG